MNNHHHQSTTTKTGNIGQWSNSNESNNRQSDLNHHTRTNKNFGGRRHDRSNSSSGNPRGSSHNKKRNWKNNSPNSSSPDSNSGKNQRMLQSSSSSKKRNVKRHKTNNDENNSNESTSKTSSTGKDCSTAVAKLDGNNPVHVRRMEQRYKAIQKGKNTVGYSTYIQQYPNVKDRVPRSMITPSTPDHKADISTKRWQGIVKAWRVALHRYDPPELTTTATATTTPADAMSSPTTSTKTATAAISSAESNKDNPKTDAAFVITSPEVYQHDTGDDDMPSPSDSIMSASSSSQHYKRSLHDAFVGNTNTSSTMTGWGDMESDDDDDDLL